jgi:hypothetical protein
MVIVTECTVEYICVESGLPDAWCVNGYLFWSASKGSTRYELYCVVIVVGVYQV